MAEYSRIATGSYTLAATGNAQIINLPFQPTLVKLTNYTAYSAFALHGIPSATWDLSMGQGKAAVLVNTAGPVLQTSVVSTAGISTFANGLALQFGPALQIVTFVKTTNVVTTSTAHGLSVGSVVTFQGLYQSATTGMPQIAGIPFVVLTVPTTTTFTIAWPLNQSNYTSLSGSPAGATVMQILYPNLYIPGWNVIEALTFGSSTTVTTTTNHNYVVGQEIAFRIPTVWLNAQISPLLNNTAPTSAIYAYVSSVTSNTQFVCTLNTTNISTFITNQTVASVNGLSFPQVIAVGDVNTGGFPYNGGNLYPSPAFPTFSGGVPTINGPAIQGAFVNNTSQGFIIGAGAATADASSNLSGTTSDFVVWEAYLPDFGS